MIGFIRGKVVDRGLQQLLVDVAGVGYEVETPLATAGELAEVSGPVTLYTHLLVREDAHQLFGFVSKKDRELFRALIKVKGLGPKLALAVLSRLDGAGFARAVQAGDVTALTAVPGVGKRTAGQIILDMKDKLPASETPVGAGIPDEVTADAQAALVALGYHRRQAASAIAQAGSGADVETVIRRALKQLMRPND